MNSEQPIIVGLDIGTTKIAAIAGRKNEFGKLEVLGFGKANSNGVKHGQVLNIDETIKAIRTALDNCFASNPNLDINDVYVGIAGHHIKSLQTRGDIVRQANDEEISQKEIDQLISDQYKTYIPAGDQIIDVIPQEYTVDNFQNIADPIGYSGVMGGAKATGRANESAVRQRFSKRGKNKCLHHHSRFAWHAGKRDQREKSGEH